MTIATPINKERLRNHLTYSGWKYLLLVIASIFVWNLVYAQTAYRSPQDKRIDVYIKSGTTTTELVNAFLEPIWKKSVPEMEIVDSVLLLDSSDYSAAMQLTVYLGAGEGDIYILPMDDYRGFASSGAFVELEGLVADGSINAEGIDLSAGYVQVAIDSDEEGYAVYGDETHLYGIPTDSLYGFLEGMQIDNRGRIMCINVNNGNDENVIPFFNALLQAVRSDKPWPLE